MQPRWIAASTTRSQPAPATTSNIRYEPTIIELFGVPGAGKTTLANAVIEAGYPHTRAELTGAWGRLALRQRSALLLRALFNIRCLGSAVRFAFRTRLASSESLVRLVRLIAKTHWMRSQPEEMLLDQSFLQEIWSICIVSGKCDPDQATLVRLIRCLYAGLKTQIVFVDADATTASQRIGGRNHGFSRLDGLPTPDVEAQLARTARLPHAIVTAAMVAGLPVERLDGSNPVDVNADLLRLFVMGP